MAKGGKKCHQGAPAAVFRGIKIAAGAAAAWPAWPFTQPELDWEDNQAERARSTLSAAGQVPCRRMRSALGITAEASELSPRLATIPSNIP